MGKLAPATELVFNDAPWLTTGAAGGELTFLCFLQGVRGEPFGVLSLPQLPPDRERRVRLEIICATSAFFRKYFFFLLHYFAGGQDFRFVHPKISAGVGDRVGARSLRQELTARHAADLDFGLDDNGSGGVAGALAAAGAAAGLNSESFGQSESITRR